MELTDIQKESLFELGFEYDEPCDEYFANYGKSGYVFINNQNECKLKSYNIYFDDFGFESWSYHDTIYKSDNQPIDEFLQTIHDIILN